MYLKHLHHITLMCARFADDCRCKMHTLKIKKRMARGGF